jgi:EAL domain-containing protein (putative c-di-GMP-specific phosphodiesterase class I)
LRILTCLASSGSGLNLPVVAEGVETEEQSAFLRGGSCDQMQGYRLGRPRPIKDYADVVGRSQTHRNCS